MQHHQLFIIISAPHIGNHGNRNSFDFSCCCLMFPVSDCILPMQNIEISCKDGDLFRILLVTLQVGYNINRIQRCIWITDMWRLIATFIWQCIPHSPWFFLNFSVSKIHRVFFSCLFYYSSSHNFFIKILWYLQFYG